MQSRPFFSNSIHQALQDEIRSIQTLRAKALDNEDGRSGPRASIDSGRSATRVASPKPALAANDIDMTYLKNVLLQFMELRDKNQRTQLVPALAMLLNLDRKEEQKWMSVVQSR